MSHDPPTPSFTFTIPSIHDDVDLDCRIYNSPPSTLFPPESKSPWKPRGAVVAHPYAPLGGCYDDLIVLAVVEECLQRGFVVGTFNFRGAPGSKGSTSWTSKSEIDDYISFTNLFINYLQTLACSPSPLHPPSRSPPDTHLTPVPSNAVLQSHPSTSPSSLTNFPHQPINLILAGYSYGSLITSHLPPTPLLQQRFASPQPGDAQSEILARAHSLATQTLKDAQRQLQHDAGRGRGQGQSDTRISIGGEEGPPGSRRPSRDNSRKSIDAVRRSVDHTRRSIDRSRRRLFSLKQRGGGSSSGGSGAGEGCSTEEDEMDDEEEYVHPGTPSSATAPNVKESDSKTRAGAEIRTSYLLISPLLGPVAGLATLSLSTMLNSPSSLFSSSSSSSTTTTTNNNQNNKTTNNDLILLQTRTLIIYGSNDFFTSAKKLRRWCTYLKSHTQAHSQLSPQSQSQDQAQTTTSNVSSGHLGFQSEEIPSAGHFWREPGAEASLRRRVGGWIEGICGL